MIASAHLGKSPPQGGEAAEPWLGSRERLVAEEVEAIDLCHLQGGLPFLGCHLQRRATLNPVTIDALGR